MNQRLLQLGAALLMLLCCSPRRGPLLMEVVALDKENPLNFSLQVVEADPLNNPFSSESDTIELCSMMDVRLSDIAKVAEKAASFSELRSMLRGRFGGKPTELLVSSSNGILRGSSYESILGLSAYYHLIEISKFAKRAGLLEGFKAAPLKVSLYGSIFAHEDSDFPFPANDNALYIGSVDTMMLLPVGENEGLPVPMHEGVLAHEFHHRIFFYKVWINDGEKKSWQRYQARYNPHRSAEMTRSERLLAATDEALADIFAVVYTHLPNYLCLSLTTKKGEEVCEQRDLEGSFAHKATYDKLAGRQGNQRALGSCGISSRNFTSPTFNYYCLATVIAKTLYDAAKGDIEIITHSFLPAVNRSLDTIARTLALGLEYDLDIFLEALAGELQSGDPTLQQQLCEQIKLRFSSLYEKSRIPSCEPS